MPGSGLACTVGGGGDDGSIVFCWQNASAQPDAHQISRPPLNRRKKTDGLLYHDEGHERDFSQFSVVRPPIALVFYSPVGVDGRTDRVSKQAKGTLRRGRCVILNRFCVVTFLEKHMFFFFRLADFGSWLLLSLPVVVHAVFVPCGGQSGDRLSRIDGGWLL